MNKKNVVEISVECRPACERAEISEVKIIYRYMTKISKKIILFKKPKNLLHSDFFKQHIYSN